MRTIEFYRTSSGDCPVEDFLDSLSDRNARKVVWVLRLIERLEIIPQQYLKKLVSTDDLWEIRAQMAGNSYRLLGFFESPRLLILTNGFAKKKQKTPSTEIELARKRRAEHLKRRLRT